MKHKQYFTTSNQLLAYDLIRIYLGIGLVIKGIQFIFSPDTLLLLLKTSQVQMFSTFSLFYVPVAHIFGGAMLMLGFLTRLASWIQIPILFGAAFFVNFNNNILIMEQNFEFSLLVLFLLLIYGIFGAGLLSLDHKLSKD